MKIALAKAKAIPAMVTATIIRRTVSRTRGSLMPGPHQDEGVRLVDTSPLALFGAGRGPLRCEVRLDLTPQYTRLTSVLASQPIRHTPTNTTQLGSLHRWLITP